MMRQEFVTRRGWLDEDRFFDFLGIANLVPGPNATEMAIMIGFHHAGWAGMITAGVCYIVPAMLIVLILAWAYVQFGALPELAGILYAIKPVVVAILISAMWGMLKPRIKNLFGMFIVAGVLIAYLVGVSPLILLLGGGILMVIARWGQGPENGLIMMMAGFPVLNISSVKAWTQAVSFNLARLFWVFLKAGALMYGSGYVLLAFIHDDLVVRLGWLTDSQMVDAIAIGQVTPGPLSTTATFVGYLLGGIPAALLATLAMFLPSFLFVGIVYFLIKKIQESGRYAGMLDGVNFAALGLMAGVTWEITRTALVDPITAGISAVALFLLVRYDVDTPWLILGASVLGLLRILIR